MTGTLYRKRGRRYEPVGREWDGWPADGIWLVTDARQQCILRLGDIDGPMPTALLPLLMRKPAVVDRVMERARKRGTWSPESIIDDTLSVLAELAEPKATA